jgi:hypothetical protein
MRLWKMFWAAAGAAALFAGRSSAEGPVHWLFTEHEPWITWYAPNSPYPNYFGPPYPYSSYLPSAFTTPPVLTGVRVKEELIHQGVYPVPPPLPPKEELPKPKEEKNPEKVLPPPKPEDKTPIKELPGIK